MLVSLLAFALVDPIAPALTETSAGTPHAFMTLGSEQAATQVDAYLDPLSSKSLYAVLELRRWAGERRDVAARIHLTHLDTKHEPRKARVRAWVAMMTEHGLLLSSLRTVVRDGVDRLYARLSTEASRSELAAELGLHAQAFASIATAERASVRAAIAMEHANRRVTSQMRARGSGVFRLPVFVVDDQAFEDSGTLDRLRPAVGKRNVRRFVQRTRARLPGKPRDREPQLVRPQLQVAPLGGVGLPHVFVVMARDEDDPVLASFLPPLLEFRDRHPGMLAVHVVARGVGLKRGLRVRLCQAEQAGLTAAYLDTLALDPPQRAADPATLDLAAALDASKSDCSDEPRDAEEQLPDGSWLDGVPVTRSDLEDLAQTLRMLHANSSATPAHD